VYGDGQRIRDWLYVDDHARGIDKVIRKGAIGETYNIGGVNEWANIDIVNLLCKEVDQRLEANPQLAHVSLAHLLCMAGRYRSDSIR